MIDINEYRTMFAEKLKETTSFDDAFRKVIHRAYQAGIVDADGTIQSSIRPEDNRGQPLLVRD